MEFNSWLDEEKVPRKNVLFHSGILFVYNVHFYENGNHRENSEKDVKALTETFHEMNADVVYISDDTLADIQNNRRSSRTDGLTDSARLIQKMNKIKKYDFKDYEYVAIAVLAHGTNNGIAMLYGETELVSIREIFLEPLIVNNSLRKKLKWIIAASCRGKNFTAYKKFSANINELPIQNQHYYLLIFSTTEGCIAFRTEVGSFFIQDLCAVLKERKHEADFFTIYEEVATRLETRSKNLSEGYFTQTPTKLDNLRGTFKFFKTTDNDKTFFIDKVWK